ncbi:MAG: hypothetical protein L0H63_14970, partial [Nitrococcus sp.]|nr:hypothetical protein [Nitrococcus sp.]
MQCVTVDTGGIQGYVFGSNRLQENIGASHLVAQATCDWVVETLRTAGTTSNVTATGVLDDHQCIEQGGIDAELIYAGGGNALVMFRNPTQAERFTRELSTMALARAPGLQLHIVVGKPFDWGINSLKQAHENLAIELAEQKQAPELSAPLLGLGVTRPCQSTGLPATGQANVAGEHYPAHASIHAKLAAAGSSEWNRQSAAEQ